MDLIAFVPTTDLPRAVAFYGSVLGWYVPDIRATIAELTSRGGTFTRYDGMPQDSLGVWTTPPATGSPGSPIPTPTPSP
ncbi:VOC family protein [Kutzneria kofuensis]|uniref:Putative enzyme related to lactoylglutathione lyase n=1 Tax=Kutzneria kofuensis TaxID=103725 RepID=A0A7W9KHQ1_9PSEU|nr:hypothetical protein [Kutzneria kofuensis]MBB5892817.1 putative enzyme related to lactoylglutathione lyase [Kutzneria kofuensis]